MKNRRNMLFAGCLSVALLVAGCSNSAGGDKDTSAKGLETDAVKISQYRGVEIEEITKPKEPTDEDVESSIQSVLQQNATQKEIKDRAVKDGDTAVLDFVGKVDGKEFDGGSSTDYPLTIGSGMFIDGFEDSVIGHKPDDTYDWKGKFPDDYTSEELAGKDVTFTITVKSITESELPELTDKFVQEVSEKSKTVEEYKKELKAQIKENNQSNYDMTLKQTVWQQVLQNTEVKKYPDGMVDEYKEQLIEQYKSMAEYYEKEYEEFIEQQMGYTIEEFEEQAGEAAKSSVMQQLVSEAIAKEEHLEPSAEEYEKKFKDMAALYGYEDADALKEAADEEELKQMALLDIVQDWLAEHCVQVEPKAEKEDTSNEVQITEPSDSEDTDSESTSEESKE